MSAPTIALRYLPGRCFVTFDRVAQGNTFTAEQLAAVANAVEQAEADPDCKMVVLEGRDGLFCRGLDFADGLARERHEGSAAYLDLLEGLMRAPLLVVAHVDGQALAGGLGFVAASDYAIATPRSSFALPEANWGLVPACVGLALDRRVGRQHARRLALTTEILDSEAALACGLIDEISEAPAQRLRKLWVKIGRLERRTIARIKRYFDELPSDGAERRAVALRESQRQMNDPDVRAKISAWLERAALERG